MRRSLSLVYLFFLSILLSGCVVDDYDVQVDECIAEKKGISSRIAAACAADPVFTDCGINEGYNTIGSGCTKKYEGKTPYEKEQLCVSNTANLDVEMVTAIVRQCMDENSRESVELAQTIALFINIILSLMAIGAVGMLAVGIFVSTETGSNYAEGVSRNKKGAKSLLVSSDRRSVKDGLLDSNRYQWIIENCRDIKARRHICKNDFQTVFRELAYDYIKYYPKFSSQIGKDEIIELLAWAISVIPDVYIGKSAPQGEKRRASYEDFIRKLEELA